MSGIGRSASGPAIHAARPSNGRRADSRRRSDDGRALTRSFGNDLERALLGVVEPQVRALGDKAGEAGQALRPADRLEILVEHLIGGRLPRGLRERLSGLVRRRRAVQQRRDSA